MADKPTFHYGLALGTISIFLSMLGASVTLPHLQAQRDRLGCDALCYGSMQSARSALSLIGSTLAGRLSDRFGRSSILSIGLTAAIISYFISLYANSIKSIWLAMIPAALLNQNYSVLKALFADYQSDLSATESSRAAALGRLGMSVGVAFMIGPILAATFLKTHSQAMSAAILFTSAAEICLLLLPVPHTETKRKLSSRMQLNDMSSNNDRDGKDGKVSSSMFDSARASISAFFSLPAAQTYGARLLFFMRCGMGLAFHIFMAVWPASLRSRFDFGPTKHAYFLAWIGLWFALSQGFIAQFLIKRAGEDVTYVIMLCMLALGIGRVFALFTTSLVLMYTIMALVIISLGVVNTAISSACTRLAGADQVGGLFGIMEAVENLAGLIGPALGGILYRYDGMAPIVTVVSIYMTLLVAVAVFFKPTIVHVKVNPIAHDKTKSE